MKCRIRATGNVHIHNTLHNTAYHFKRRLDAHATGKQEISGADLEKLACLAFLAFSVEAHANFVADVREIPSWDDQWNWEKKLKAILKGHEPDWNKPPLSIIRQLFELRNLLAHGRPFSDNIKQEVEVEVADLEAHKQLIDVAAPWENLLNTIDYEEAYSAVDELWKVMLEIHEINLIDTLCGGGFEISYSEE